MATTIDSLELQIKNGSNDAVKGIDSLTSSLERLKTASKDGLGLTSVINQLNELGKATESQDDSSIEKISKLNETLSKLSTLGNINISPNIASEINRISDALKNIDSSSIGNLDNITQSIKGLSSSGDVSLPNVSPASVGTPNVGLDTQSVSGATNEVQRYTEEVSNAKQQTQEWGSKFATVGANIGQVKGSFTNAASGIKTFGSSLKDVASAAAGKAASAFKNVTSKAKALGSGIKAVGSTVKGAVSKVTSFTSSLKSLGRQSDGAKGKLGQFLASVKRIAMYRAIRAFFSMLTNAMREGIQNLYQYSNLIGGTFAGSMNKLATDFQYLKNSMGAMVAPLINAVAPAVDFLVDKFVSLLNVVNQFFTRLTGKSTFTAAKKQAVSYGGAVSSAGSAAKSAAKEIKDATLGIDELNIISKQEANTSSSGGSGESSPDYGTMFEEVAIDNSVSDFADRVKAAFEAGNWQELGTVIGNQFNTIVDSINWAGMGQTIGGGINGAVQTAYYALRAADFQNLGGRVAEFLNNALGSIDFTKLGGLIQRLSISFFDMVIGFIKNTDWGLVGKTIGDYFRGMSNEFYEWVCSIDWSQLAHDLYNGLKNLITGIDFASVATSLFSALGAALGAAVSFLFTFIGDIWNSITEYFSSYITNDDGTKKSGIDWVMGILQGIWDAIAGIGQWIYDNVFKPFIDGFKNVFGIHSPSTVMEEQGGFIVQGLWDGIKGLIGGGLQLITGWASSIFNWFTGGDGQGNIFQKFAGAAGNIVNSVKDTIGNTYNTVKDKVVGWKDSVCNWFTGGDGKGNIFEKFKNTAGNLINGFKEKISKNYETNKEVMTRWATKTTEWFTDTDGNGNIFQKFNSAAMNVVNGFKDGIANTFNKCKDTVCGWASSVTGWFKDKLGINSPSRVFAELAGFTVLGYNEELSKEGKTTEGIVNKWVDSFTDVQPQLACGFAVDTSGLDYYDSDSYMRNLQTEVRTKSMFTASGFKDGMEDFYHEWVEPVLLQMAGDVRKQANKEEKTVVQIGNRTVYDVVTNQKEANGYSFVK